MTNNDARPGRALRRWMQAVGAFYLVQAVMMVFVRAPIRTFGPKGALAEADAGDPIAMFLVDTWTLGQARPAERRGPGWPTSTRRSR